MSEFKPLAGIKVIEWSTFIAAPVCGRMLADWGADVIKLETPEGDYWRIYGPKVGTPAEDDENPIFDITNANKRSITLDLRTVEGREIMEKLIAQSDIMITNTRERVLKKLGYDYESVSQRYPGIIYAQLSGYGDDGPEANRPGYDAVTYWAYSGFLADMKQDEPGSVPINIPIATGDIGAGSLLFGAVMAALTAKYRTGKGDKVSVSLLGEAVWFMGMMHTVVQPRYTYHYPRKRNEAKPAATYYKCKDGEYIIVCAVQHTRDFPRLCQALGLDELATDPRYLTFDDMMLDENRLPLLETFTAKFLEKTAAEWNDIFEKYDLVHDVLVHYQDVWKNEQVRANHFLEEVTFRNGGTAWLPRPAIVSENLGIPEYNLAPIMGEHSEEIIAELGYSEEEIAHLHEIGAFYGTEHKAVQR